MPNEYAKLVIQSDEYPIKGIERSIKLWGMYKGNFWYPIKGIERQIYFSTTLQFMKMYPIKGIEK